LRRYLSGGDEYACTDDCAYAEHHQVCGTQYAVQAFLLVSKEFADGCRHFPPGPHEG
jgi:hypothetical protein